MVRLYNLNIAQLKEYIKNRNIYCFGCGIQGKRAAMFLENWGILEQLKGYIDNNKEKVGTKVCIENRTYPVYSLDKLEESLTSDDLILVTCLNYKSVYEQLEMVQEIESKYIALDEVAEEQLMVSDYNHVVHESKKPLIPKKIHYTWLGADMPPNLRKNIEHWKQLCPDYEFYEWNDRNYDVSVNQYMNQAYERKMWGFVSDYMRLDIIYKYGGIYLDTDIEMIRKPDDLLYQQCFGCVDASLVMNLGSGFGAAPQADIIRELRDYYNDIPFVKENGSIDNTSCNSHSHNVLKKHGVRINDELQNVHGMNIYPMIFQGACQYTRKRKVTDKTYWIHYGNMSWFNKEDSYESNNSIYRGRV